ncbi:MAG: LPD23 domain-containing protein [Phocaeicola vulgatus]|nr:LPD23 domain-containing protein [Bacteroides sp.]MDU9008233.1 LPD23 domain-containing protein [Phocaeicola vulgatus]
MQDNNTARKKVYDVLRDKTGYSDSYEDFNKFMDENEEARKKVYDVLKDKTGYSDSYEDFNQFMQPVDSSVQIQQPNNTPQTPKSDYFQTGNGYDPVSRTYSGGVGTQEEADRIFDMRNYNPSTRPGLREQVHSKDNFQFIPPSTSQMESDKAEVSARYQFSPINLGERLKVDMDKGKLDKLFTVEEESRLDKEYTPRSISSMNDVYNNYRDRFALTERGRQLSEEMAGIQKEIQDKYANRFLASDEYRKLSQQYKGNELNQKANEAFQKTYGEVISKELESYQDVYNKEITSRYGTDMKRDLAGFVKKSVGSHLSTLTNEVNKDLDDIEEKITKQKKILRNDSGNAMVNARMNTREDPTLAQYRGERTYLEGAKDLIDESNNIIEEAGKKGKTNFFSGLARGFADTAFDPKQWTLGISDMIGGIRLKNVVEKADKGEKLSPSEEKLLDAAVTNMAVNAYYSSDLGRGYKAGQTTGASIPFMLEFAINPISAAGEGIAKSILKYGMKKFGASAMKKGMSKMGARLAGDALAAAGMEGTTGLARVTAGAQDRMMGNILFDVDKDGNLTYGGREGGMDMGKAIGKSIASTFLENQSEMIFNAFKGLGKGIWKNVEETVPGGASEFMKYITNSRAGKLYREIKDNPTFKEAAKKAQFHGPPEEYMEEVYNNLANVPLGEMTLEEATDLDNNIDTFLGLAPTSVAFGLLGLGSMGAERVRHRQKMNAAFGNMTKEQQEKLSELERMSKERGNDDIRIFIKETMNDGSLSKEEKKTEIEYAFDIAKNNAMEDIAGEQTREESEKRTAAQEEGTDIYTTHDPVAMRTTVLREEVSRERLSSVLDDEAIDALAGANDAQRAEMLDVMDEETRRLATDYLRQKDRHDAVEDALDEAHASEYEQAAVKVQQMSPQGQVVTIPLGRFGDKEHSYGVVINGIDATGQPGETGTLMVVPLENGPEGPIFASFDENNAKTVRINADTEISMVGRDQVLEQMLGAYNADAAIMEAQPISAGQTFSIADDNGTVTGISVVGQDTMGNWSVLMEGSREPVSVSDEQLRAMKDNVDKAGIRTEYAQEDENRRQEELIRKFSPEVLALQPEKGDKIYTGGKEIVLDEEVPGGWSGKIIDNNGNETGSVLVTEEQYFKYKQSLFDAQRKDDAEAAPEIGASYITPEGESMTIIGFDEEIGGMFVVPTDEYNEVKSDEVSMNILENEAYQLGAVPVQEYTDWVKKSKSSTNETAPEGKEMGNQPLQESTESPTYEKSELDKLISSFPKKKDGSIDYESLTPQQSFQYTNLTESLETALDDLRKDIEASDAQIAKLNESLSSATRGKRNEIRDAIREAKAENEEIKNFYNSVIPITETNNNQTNGISESSKTGTNGNDTNEPVPVSETSEQGKERGTEKRPEAKGTGEERMGPEGIPDTGRKNSIQKPAAKISESITDTELPENPLVQEILSRTEPETLEELASLVLGKSLFLQMTGERSVRNMTGLSHKDLTPFLSIFRKKEKGGMTVEEAGDRLISIAHESYPAIVAKEGLENDNTGMAGTNAILSVLQQSRTFGDISNMIRNNRTEEAQRAIDAEKEYEDELKEQFYQEQYHMSPDEYEAWVNDEAFSESNVYSNEEKSEFYNTFADKIIKQQEYDNRRENPTDEGIGTRKSDEQGGIFGIRERGDAVLQGEKPVHAVGTEGYQGKSGQMEGQTDEGLHPQNDNVQDNTSTNKLLDHIAEAREMVDTSPTEAQKEAGNYKKGHIKLDGYDITIENPKGSVRSGKDANGQEWSITMNNDYGYIRGTKAVDGDHIDIFLSDNPSEGNVFVVDQLNEKGEFDESKVMYGFPSMDEARSSYLANYSPGWENRISTITEVTKDEFYKWIDSSVKKTKPFSEYKSVNPVQLAPSIESANAGRMKDIETRLAEIEDRKIELEDILVEAGNDSVERDAVFSEQQKLNQEQQELEAEYSGLRAMNDESNEILTSEGSDIRFREVGNEEISSFANKHNLDEADVKKYAQSMKMKNLGGASYAFKSISRNVRLQNSNLSLGQFVKVFSPIKKELYEKFGDVDALRDEYVQEEMKARNMMEAARKRAEEEAESEKKRLKEFELMTDEEMDEAYFKAMEENNEARMRDIIHESARRNGYVSADEFRMAHRAPSYDEEGIDKNMVDIAANKDQIRESLNEQLRMNRDQYKNESAAAINEALSAIDKGEKPTVTIYRAVPKSLKEGKVRNGDWISLSESYVKVHGEHALNGNYRIMKEEVPAENLYWDGNDINEWGYDDRSDYRYKNTKNNRKLNDLITRDDKGNIIPPSKRFNARKADVRYRFIGEEGASKLDKAEEATTRLDNLNVAREMESAFNTKKGRIEKLRKSEPIEITGKEVTPSDDLKQYKKNALEYGKNLQGEYTNKDTGRTIQLQRGRKNGGLKEILQHDTLNDTVQIKSVAAIPSIIENAIYIDSSENQDVQKNPNVVAYHYYICGLKIGSEDYTVRMVEAEEKDGNRYYDHKLTHIEKGKLINELALINPSSSTELSSTPDAGTEDRNRPTNRGEIQTAPISNIKDKKLVSLLQTNEKENARKIKLATGWERGADGKWRYEVEDFEIDPKGLARRNRLWSNLSWGKEYDALSDKLFDGVELTEEEAARFDELSEKAEELRATYEANDVRYLDDYVKDENLFKAYPELKQIRVEIYNAPTSNTGATYYESQNLIRVNESVLDRVDFRSILAHEVQHTVQSIEGFARGGNSMTYRKHLDALKEKRDAWSMIEEFADKREELGEDASQMDVYNALVNEYHSDGFEFGDGFIPSRNAFDKGFNLWVRGYDKEGYEDAYNEYQSLIEKFGLGGENDRYNELSGEVEARNVQSRMNMTPEERRNTLASETEDVAREDQIFINDALEAYASVSAPMNTAVNELSESLHTPIEKITSEDQLPQGEARRRIESGANIKGWYSPKENKVYLYMPNTTSVEDAQATIFHEVVAHKGLRELFGKDFDTFLDNVYNNAAPSIRQTINRMAENENISIRTATEEYMADLSERGPATFAEQSLWTRIKTFFIDMLRKAKVNLGFELTDNELRYILYESHNRLKQSNYPVDVAKETVMRSKLGIGEFSGSSRTIPSVPQGETLFRITGKEEKKEIIKNLKEEIRELKKQLDQARKGNKEEYETASRAMLSFIDQRLTKEAGEEMGPHMIKSLIAQVNKAASTNKLKEPLNLVEKLINYAQYDSSVKRMQKMIKTKLSGQDTRGVSKGIVVDEATRRVFDSIRSAYKDLLLTSADSELRAVRSEIVKLGKLIKSETSPESITILTGQQNEMKSRRDNLLKERAELLKTKELESVEEIRKRREELENAMDEAAEGTGVFTQTMADEYDSLSIRELLAESRKMKRDLDKLEGDLVTTRRVAYNNKGEARKFYLQEAEKIAAQIPVAQEELIRMTDNVYNELKALVDTGKSRLAMLNKEKAAHRGRIVSMGINAVKDKRIKGINEKETNMEKTVSILQSIGDFIAYPMYSFDYLLKAIDRNHAIGKGPLYDYFMKSSHGVVEANDRIYLGVKAYNKELEEKIKELFGKSMENVFRDSQKSEKRIHKQYMYDSNYHKEGDLYEANLNKGQAFYVWLTWRQPDGKMKLEADGWTEDSMTEIEFFIGDKYMKLGEWITDDFFPRLREERYNPVHVRMTGTSMASRENYFPMVIAKSEIREKGELGETIIGMPSTITGNIINRTINTLKVDTSRNAFDLMLKYGRDMETWAATAELRQDLNFLRGSKAFKNYMEANHKGMFDIFMRAAEVAVRSFNDKQKQDSLNNGLNKILRYWAGSNIAFRLNTAMKQVLSYPAFSAYSGKPGYQADLFKYIFTPAGNMKWAKEHLPSFEERVDTGNMGIEALKDENAFKNKLEKLTNAGMYPNKLIDALTCAAGARAVYNFEYERAQKRGLGNEEAANLAKYNAEIAFNESQQSSSPEMMSPMQASGNVFYKALTTYQSSNIGYQRMGIEGLLEMARAKRIYNLNIESGMNKDEAQRTMMGSYLTGLRKATFGLFVMGGLWAAGGYGIAGITAPLISNIYAMFGYGDGDEDLWFTDEQLKSIFLSAALSSLGGTSIGQFVNAISQGNKYDPLSFITEMSNLISEAVKDGFNLNVQRELAAKLGKFAGLNVETLENIYLGAESAIREGRPDLVDFMFLINLPKSQRKEMAEKLYKDMGPYEYLNKMYEAGKLFNDYRKKLPYSDGTSKRKDSEIKKKYIINNLNEKEKETLKNEKEFLKLKRKHDEAKDKKEWLEEHPEYPDMEKKYKKQTITKKVRKEVEKVYRQ